MIPNPVGRLVLSITLPVAMGLSVAVSLPAHATTSPSAVPAAGLARMGALLDQLPVQAENRTGYDRDLFTLWIDADGDGCDTREEVLLAEAQMTPKIGPGCTLTGGQWISRYDFRNTTNPSSFDIDHMVPLAEAWDSGASRWASSTRTAYANDLGYAGSLIAVSASSNRSKGDQDPAEWLPSLAYTCTYVGTWVAVKYRWSLSVDSVERDALKRWQKRCGNPYVATGPKASIWYTSTGGGAGGGGTGGGAGTDPRFRTCGEAIAAGFGPYYRGETEYSWYRDADSDGVVCE